LFLLPHVPSGLVLRVLIGDVDELVVVLETAAPLPPGRLVEDEAEDLEMDAEVGDKVADFETDAKVETEVEEEELDGPVRYQFAGGSPRH
jgi:hypothetical protein